MSDNGLMHRDYGYNNILYQFKNYEIKIIDLGCVGNIDSETTSYVGTPLFCSKYIDNQRNM